MTADRLPGRAGSTGGEATSTAPVTATRKSRSASTPANKTTAAKAIAAKTIAAKTTAAKTTAAKTTAKVTASGSTARPRTSKRAGASSGALESVPDGSAAQAAETVPPQPLPLSALTGSSASGWRALIDPTSPALVYAGVVGVVAGFALLFIAWSQVAAQSDVWRQMPFVLSAGFPGLGLIMTGLVLSSVGVRRQEGARRQRQMAALTEALRAAEHRAG